MFTYFRQGVCDAAQWQKIEISTFHLPRLFNFKVFLGNL
jgi:hypothetical protein